MGRWMVIAAASLVVAVVNGQRKTDGLKALYWFDQQECDGGAFGDYAAGGTLGKVKYNTTHFKAGSADAADPYYKCPEVKKNDLLYRRAHRGVHFSGERNPGLKNYEFLEAENDISGLGLTNQLTLEFWIKPQWTENPGNKNLVIFEVGRSELASSTSDWLCSPGGFSAQLSYNPELTSNSRFSLTYRFSGGCASISSLPATPLSPGKLYHVVLHTKVGDVDGATWYLYVTEHSPSPTFTAQKGYGAFPKADIWTSTHTVSFLLGL